MDLEGTPCYQRKFGHGRAAHRVVHALRPERHDREGQVAMFLYHALVAGMLVSGLVVSSVTERRTGLTFTQPFLVSPRNSRAAFLNLIQKTCYSRIVTVHGTHQTLMGAIWREAPELESTSDEIPALFHSTESCIPQAGVVNVHPTLSSRIPRPLCIRTWTLHQVS